MFRRDKRSGRDNQVTVLPRWPSGGVTLYHDSLQASLKEGIGNWLSSFHGGQVWQKVITSGFLIVSFAASRADVTQRPSPPLSYFKPTNISFFNESHFLSYKIFAPKISTNQMAAQGFPGKENIKRASCDWFSVCNNEAVVQMANGHGKW